jgi:hypothetical protein
MNHVIATLQSHIKGSELRHMRRCVLLTCITESGSKEVVIGTWDDEDIK